jgi:hypothetical protein
VGVRSTAGKGSARGTQSWRPGASRGREPCGAAQALFRERREKEAVDGAHSPRRLSATSQAMAPATLALCNGALVTPARLASRHSPGRALGGVIPSGVVPPQRRNRGPKIDRRYENRVLSTCHDYSTLSMTEADTRIFPLEGGASAVILLYFDPCMASTRETEEPG